MLLPSQERQPSVHNPFPQIARVAVVPFFNLSTDPTLDGRQVATAYFNELHSFKDSKSCRWGWWKPRSTSITLSGQPRRRAPRSTDPAGGCHCDWRRDRFLPLLPATMGLQVEWYASNPGFYPIPPGYGLPWGTHEEQDIPGPLVFEAEFALAREQLKTQTPSYERMRRLAGPGGSREGCDPQVGGEQDDRDDACERHARQRRRHRHRSPASKVATASANGDLPLPAPADELARSAGLRTAATEPAPPVCWPSEASDPPSHTDL